MTFTPPRTVGLSIGLGAIVVLLGADFLFLVLIRQTPLTIVTALWFALIIASVPTIGFLAYRTFGLVRGEYILDQNACTISWGGLREVVPMGEIARLELGRDVEATLNPGGLWWPGCLVGSGQSEELGQLAFFATAPQDYQVYIVTADGAYVVSPADVDAFVGAFEEERQKGITEPVEYETIRSSFQQWALWRDRWAQGLVILSLLTALALYGWIALVYPTLPVEVPLHFDNSGRPDRLGSPSGLFILPAIAGLVWLVNTAFGVGLHVRGAGRLAAYLLWSATFFVQALLWAATFFLLGRAG